MRLGLGLGLGMLQTGGFNPAAVNTLSWGASYLAWGDSFLVWGTGDPDPAPTFVSGSLGVAATLMTLVFSEAVTWPGANPDGFYAKNDGDYGAIGQGDREFAYTSGKGTSTLTFTAVAPFSGGGSASAIGYIGGIFSLTGNVTDTTGNALAEFAETSITNNVP